MSNPPSRRAPQQQGPSHYAAVPQSPRGSTLPYAPQPAPPGSRTGHQGNNAIAHGVASGAIGAGYGPYSVSSNYFSSFFLFLIEFSQVQSQPSKRCSHA